MAAILIPQSTKVLYASRSGVPAAGQGDATTRIQAIFDSAAGTPLKLVIDQSIQVDTIKPWSNTTIECLSGVAITKKPSSVGNLNNGLPMITNANWVTGPTTPTDKNITIRGGYWDGNRRNGGSGNAPGTGPLTSPWTPLNVFCNASSYIVPQFAFYGVTNLLIEDLETYDSCAFTFNLANVVNGMIRRTTKGIVPGDDVPGNDDFHLNGHCQNCTFADSVGASNDDFFAINCDDGDLGFPTLQPFTVYPGSIAHGPITGTRIRNIRITGGVFNLGRLLSGNSTSYSDDTLIENVSSTIPVPTAGTAGSMGTRQGLFFDSFQTGSSGLHKSVVIRGMRVECATGPIIIGQNTVQDLDISDVRMTGTNTGGMVRLNHASSTVNALRISHCRTDATAYLVQQLGGSVNAILGPNHQFSGTADFTSSGGTNTVKRVTVA